MSATATRPWRHTHTHTQHTHTHLQTHFAIFCILHAMRLNTQFYYKYSYIYIQMIQSYIYMTGKT